MSVETILVSTPFVGDYTESVSECLAIEIIIVGTEGEDGEEDEKGDLRTAVTTAVIPLKGNLFFMVKNREYGFLKSM